MIQDGGDDLAHAAAGSAELNTWIIPGVS